MATSAQIALAKAKAKQAKFKVKAEAFGYTVIRVRPQYYGKDGLLVPESRATYKVLDSPMREVLIRSDRDMGGFAGDNDQPKKILFSFDADVHESDAIEMPSLDMRFNVTKAGDPLTIADVVIYWTVMITRERTIDAGG